MQMIPDTLLTTMQGLAEDNTAIFQGEGVERGEKTDIMIAALHLNYMAAEKVDLNKRHSELAI